MVLRAIHFSNAVKFHRHHRPDKTISHVNHHRVERIAIVAISMDMQCARVNQITSVHRQIVVPNVLSVPNVQTIVPVSIINVPIHVHTLVALDLYAMLQITIQSVHAHLVIPAIHSHNAREYVSQAMQFVLEINLSRNEFDKIINESSSCVLFSNRS